MALGEFDMPKCVQGNTFSIPQIQVQISVDGVETDPEFELASVEMHVRRTANATDTLLELRSADGDITITDSVAWKIAIVPVEINIAAGVWVYDMLFTDTEGHKYTYLGGKFTSEQAVTHP